MTVLRRSISCEACGGPVGIYDESCPYCQTQFEPLGDVQHRLPSARTNPNAKHDSELLKPFLDQFDNFCGARPSDMDELYVVLKSIRNHGYPYRDYLLEFISLSVHFRHICLENDQESRTAHLEILKRLEAIYASLTI